MLSRWRAERLCEAVNMEPHSPTLAPVALHFRVRWRLHKAAEKLWMVGNSNDVNSHLMEQ